MRNGVIPRLCTLLAVAVGFMPGQIKAADFYDVDMDIRRNSGSLVDHNDFTGAHHPIATDSFDAGIDSFASFAEPPGDYVKTITYTESGDGKLDIDYRSNGSLIDHDIKTRYMSNHRSFEGSAEMSLSFKAGGTEYIDPYMFYVGEAVAESQFRTNGVRQVDKKALLSNRGPEGKVPFNLEGLQASHNDDFVQLNIHREYNDLHFDQPAHGSIAVSDLSDSSSITNSQRFIYDDMVDAGVSINSGEGYHISSVEVVRRDINSGDSVTNNVAFSSEPGNYITSFSTNMNDIVGHNTLEAVISQDAPQAYNFVFKDPRNNVNATNTVAQGDSIQKAFPEFIYSPDRKTRSRAKSVTADGVDVVAGGSE